MASATSSSSKLKQNSNSNNNNTSLNLSQYNGSNGHTQHNTNGYYNNNNVNGNYKPQVNGVNSNNNNHQVYSTMTHHNSSNNSPNSNHYNNINSQYNNLHIQHINSQNGNATTNSSGSSSGYDSSSISTITPVILTSNTSLHDYSTHSNSSGGTTLSKSSSPSVMNTLSSSSSKKMMTLMKNSEENDKMFNDLSGEELNNLMNAQLSLMDLPPDKLKIVKMLPDEKKLEFVKSCRFLDGNGKNPPEYYIQALSTYIDVIVSQKTSSKRSKFQINETSTELIKALEVSLRTNRIDWVHKFLDPPLNGLDILIEYLKNSLNIMRENDRYANLDQNDTYGQHHLNGSNAPMSNTGTLPFSGSGNSNGVNGLHVNNGLSGSSNLIFLLYFYHENKKLQFNTVVLAFLFRYRPIPSPSLWDSVTST